MHSRPKILTATLSQRATVASAPFPGLVPVAREVDGPADQRQHEPDVGTKGGRRCEIRKLRGEDLELAGEFAAAERAQAALPCAVGQEIGPRRVSQQWARRMPAQMLANTADAVGRRVEIEHPLEVGGLERDQRDHAVGPTGLVRQLLRPPHLAHGIVRQKLRPHRLDDVKGAHVAQVVLRQIDPRQSAVVAKESFESRAALDEHGIPQAARVEEMLVTIEDRKLADIHGTAAASKLIGEHQVRHEPSPTGATWAGGRPYAVPTRRTRLPAPRSSRSTTRRSG
jgi:hypothetical protein